MSIVYRPLREKYEEIRLLDLEPAARLDDPLRGTLRHAQLRKTSYFTLSYVWGQSARGRSDIAVRYERTARQYLSSKLHGNSSTPTYIQSIGSSLAEALRPLRQKYGRITIWADALCISTQPRAQSPSILFLRYTRQPVSCFLVLFRNKLTSSSDL